MFKGRHFDQSVILLGSVAKFEAGRATADHVCWLRCEDFKLLGQGWIWIADVMRRSPEILMTNCKAT